MRPRSRFVRVLLITTLSFITISVSIVILLRWVPVRYTPVMLKRAFQFRNDRNYHPELEWVSLEEISPELIKAVLASEDQRFYTHHGFDWRELGIMFKAHNLEGAPIRGCSTISQQTAKNVFTFGSRTVFRKAVEAYWTVLIELIWGKRRILEVYLNIAETGRGLYGVEAAARHYYGIPARRLDAKQSAAIAICLSRPLVWRPDQPGGEQRSQIKSLAEI